MNTPNACLRHAQGFLSPIKTGSQMHKKFLPLATAVLVFVSSNALAEIEKKSIPANPTVGNIAGNSVDMSQHVMAVGIPYQTNKKGMVSMYLNTGPGIWSEFQQIIPFDAQLNDEFGNRVALDSDTNRLIAGSAKKDITNTPDAGKSYIYEYDSSATQWVLKSSLVSPDVGAFDEFGFSNGISGNYAIVGARWDDNPKGVNAGSAYIYERNSSNGVWSVKEKLIAPDGVAEDEFGFEVAINGDIAVVGTIGKEQIGPNNPKSGAAYVYMRNPVTKKWDFSSKLMAHDGHTADLFGYSIDIKNGEILIGSPEYAPGSGRAYIARYVEVAPGPETDSANPPKQWVLAETLAAPDGVAGNHLGHGVGLSANGQYLVLGASRDTGSAAVQGSIYVFKKTGVGNTQWQFYTKLTANSPVAQEALGNDVDIHSCEVAGGAPNYLGFGAVYTFADIGIPCN